ncbi:hypothetical protein L1049_008729 [Liquidambar formosana]|uniref:Uncharacterized protein n=1 Tax=Liquidambar formosana TaxID=63359 RepID=A0AAP0X2I2_LIQFO
MDTSAFVGDMQGSNEHDGYGEPSMDMGLSSVGWNACHGVRQRLLSLISANQFKQELQRCFQIPDTVFVYGT